MQTKLSEYTFMSQERPENFSRKLYPDAIMRASDHFLCDSLIIGQIAMCRDAEMKTDFFHGAIGGHDKYVAGDVAGAQHLCRRLPPGESLLRIAIMAPESGNGETESGHKYAEHDERK